MSKQTDTDKMIYSLCDNDLFYIRGDVTSTEKTLRDSSKRLAIVTNRLTKTDDVPQELKSEADAVLKEMERILAETETFHKRLSRFYKEIMERNMQM